MGKLIDTKCHSAERLLLLLVVPSSKMPNRRGVAYSRDPTMCVRIYSTSPTIGSPRRLADSGQLLNRSSESKSEHRRSGKRRSGQIDLQTAVHYAEQQAHN